MIDDEPGVRKFLRKCLEGADYKVFDAEDGFNGIEAVRRERPDLLILDIGLPDINGFEVTTMLREWSALPVIIVSARDQEEDIVRALDSGADDYLTKPFGVSELLARVRAALRRKANQATPGGDGVFGALKVDLQRRLVTRGDEEVSLTPTEYDLLKAFVEEPDRVLTHHYLMGEVWGRGYDDLQILRVNISNLRRKIEADSRQPKLLVTEPGVGYRLRSRT